MNPASTPVPPKDTVSPEHDQSLPRPATSFIGREHDVAHLVERFSGDDVRLVTLTGPGGVGKTRLALRVAEAVAARGEDVWFVSLAAIHDPALVPATIADTLRARPDITLTAEQAIMDLLRDQTGLLVLDNLEHVLGVADQVPGLLVACPRLRILATSRVPLNLSAEHLHAVQPLGVAEDDDASEAVRLFVARARLRQSTFQLDQKTTEEVTRICRVLDGLPLAIELAAARIATMTLSDLLRRVAGSLDLLAGGPRDAPPRQRTLRETIAWSYDLLSAEERALFRRLGVFVGGCTLDAAAAVTSAGADTSLDAITTLVQASLLDVITGPMDTTRYVMLDTIRAFALERLAAEDDDRAVRAAHARYFVALAEAALPGYDGPELVATNARMVAELDNARAAIAWTYEAGERETAVRLSGALWHAWLYTAAGATLWSDRIAEGWRYTERALAASDGLPVAAVTEAYAGATCFACLRGDLDRAQRIAAEHAARAESEHDPYAQHWAAFGLGNVALARGHWVEAARHYEDALALAPMVRNPENHAAMCLIHLGIIALSCGDPRSGAGHFEQARELARVCGNPLVDVWSLQGLGQCRRELGDYPAAIALLAESHAACRRIGNQSGMAAALVALAIIALRLGNTARARLLLHATATSPRLVEDQAEFGTAIALLRDATGAGLEALPNGETLTPDASEVLEILEAMQAEIVAAHNLPVPPSPGGLTPRELDVVRLVATGKSNRAIADTLSVSERTVENHLSHILAKLNVDSRTAAVAMAADLGIVELRRPPPRGQYLDRS